MIILVYSIRNEIVLSLSVVSIVLPTWSSRVGSLGGTARVRLFNHHYWMIKYSTERPSRVDKLVGFSFSTRLVCENFARFRNRLSRRLRCHLGRYMGKKFPLMHVVYREHGRMGVESDSLAKSKTILRDRVPSGKSSILRKLHSMHFACCFLTKGNFVTLWKAIKHPAYSSCLVSDFDF